jgi:hypothetical protein
VTTAYPLSWPPTMPRAKIREKGALKTSLAGALKNVETSIKMFSRDSSKVVSALVISSNVTLGRERPTDAGVAVWFTWDRLQVCIPVDRYLTVEANLQAIHHVIEARRVELRHGTLALVRASFQGFTALPAPDTDHWSDVLGVPKTAKVDDIERAYRSKAKDAHPDKGGSAEAMHRLTAAKDKALAERIAN